MWAIIFIGIFCLLAIYFFPTATIILVLGLWWFSSVSGPDQQSVATFIFGAWIGGGVFDLVFVRPRRLEWQRKNKEKMAIKKKVEELRVEEAAKRVLAHSHLGAERQFAPTGVTATEDQTVPADNSATSVVRNTLDHAAAKTVRKVLLVALGIWLAIMVLGLSASFFGR